MSEKPSKRQVATRVSDEDFEVLKVGLVLMRANTMQDLLAPVIAEYAASLRDDPSVTEILSQAEQYRDRIAGVKRLPNRENQPNSARK